jgi:N-acetylmuramoyl-L-alanine amidase
MAVYDPESDKLSRPAVGNDDIAKKEEAVASDNHFGGEDTNAGVDKERDFFRDDAADAHNASIGGLKGKVVKFGSKKLLVGGIGAGLATAIIVIGSLLGFLNVFKLDHIMQNIEARAFSRYQVALDGRSDKWIKTYIMLRLSEIDGMDGDIKEKNLLFKAGKVDTNNPLTDWYRTLRTSKFEEDLLKNSGIEFASVARREGDMVVLRPAVITIDGKENTLFELSNNMDKIPIDEITEGKTERYKNIITDLDSKSKVDIFKDHKTARVAIKKAVNDHTKSWQVIKRRHIRKWIQNKIGVRSWRFFDKTRTKIENKIISIRNKIIKYMLPDSTVMGKVVQCIFGVTACRASTDLANPDTSAKGNPDTNTQKSEDTTATDGDTEVVKSDSDELANLAKDAEEKTVKELGEAGIEVGAKTIFVKNLVAGMGEALPIINIVQAVDTLNTLNNTFSSGALNKIIIAARGAQAMGLYTTFMTARDNLRTGNVTGEEVGELMQVLGSVSNSEGWTSVIGNSDGTAKAAATTVEFAADRAEYCSDTHQEAIAKNPAAYENEFHYLCDDKKIGGTSLAASIEDWWKNNIGKVLGPIMDIYEHTPAKFSIGIVNDILGFVGDLLIEGVKAVMPDAVMAKVEDAFSWVITKVATFAGAGPMLNGDEPSGVYANTIIQGAAYSAETSSRSNGAALTTSLTQSLSNKMVATYYDDYYGGQSVFDRYLSLENQDSTLSQSLFATVENNTVNNFAGMFGQLVKSIAKVPFSIFSKPVAAGTESPYAAANFAGIETYDFPQECYDLDPLTMTPQSATNADDSGIIPADELTWEIVNDSEAFYNLLYQKLREIYKGNDSDQKIDEAAKLIYNCGSFDTTVRGGLGYMYGYTGDYGLESTDAVTSNQGAYQSVIVIDPGHSGSPLTTTDPVTGIRDEEYYNKGETEAVYDVAVILKAKLEAAGYTVLMTKKSALDTVPKRTRDDIANNNNAALAVSIHTSGHSFGNWGEIYVQTLSSYRSTDSGQKTFFTNKTVADLSQQYGQNILEARKAIEGSSLKIAVNSSFGGRDLAAGNIPLVQLFSNVPWIYNEAGTLNSAADKEGYAQGLFNGIVKSVPIQKQVGSWQYWLYGFPKPYLDATKDISYLGFKESWYDYEAPAAIKAGKILGIDPAMIGGWTFHESINHVFLDNCDDREANINTPCMVSRGENYNWQVGYGFRPFDWVETGGQDENKNGVTGEGHYIVKEAVQSMHPGESMHDIIVNVINASQERYKSYPPNWKWYWRQQITNPAVGAVDANLTLEDILGNLSSPKYRQLFGILLMDDEVSAYCQGYVMRSYMSSSMASVFRNRGPSYDVNVVSADFQYVYNLGLIKPQ